MSLLRPTPGMPMWPLAMKGKEASSVVSTATGMARPTAGPSTDSERTSRKTIEATSRMAQQAIEVASSPGSRMATVQTRIRVAKPTAPSRKQACLRPSASRSARPTSRDESRITPAIT